MAQGPASKWRQNLKRILDADWQPAFKKEWRQHVVSIPGRAEPFLAPYISRVGADYEKHGIMALATAQNLAQFSGLERSDTRLDNVAGPVGHEHLRLYGPAHYTRVAIAPFADGFLPALAGLLSYAVDGRVEPDLQRTADAMVAGNFFRFSFRQRGSRVPWVDMHPVKLGKKEFRAYRQATFGAFVRPELEVLRPRHLFVFRRLLSREQAAELKRDLAGC